MQQINFDEQLEQVVTRDPRYHRDAYLFLRGALDHTQKQFGRVPKGDPRTPPGPEHHVTGQELLSGIRDYALAQFGPMTKTLLTEWGIHRGEDFGEMVFNLVDSGLLSKTDQDTRDDFKGGYDFGEAFCKPFLPSKKLAASKPDAESKPAEA